MPSIGCTSAGMSTMLTSQVTQPSVAWRHKRRKDACRIIPMLGKGSVGRALRKTCGVSVPRSSAGATCARSSKTGTEKTSLDRGKLTPRARSQNQELTKHSWFCCGPGLGSLPVTFVFKPGSHVRVPGAHLLVEFRLQESQGAFHLLNEFIGLRGQPCAGYSVFARGIKRQPSFVGELTGAIA